MAYGDGIEKFISKAMKQKIMAGLTPRWIRYHPRGAYIADSYLAATLWIRRADIRPLAEARDKLTAETGVIFVLDHIIPIAHDTVCGLTVPWNLQIVPWRVNASKRNAWHPNQLALDFEESAQP